METTVSYSERKHKESFAFGHSQLVSVAILDGMSMYKEALNWLQKRCEAESRASVMRQVGAAKATFYKAVGGTQEPSAPNFMTWLEALGAKIIFPGAEDDFSEYTFIPRALAKPAAGGGSLETSGETEGALAFRREWISRKTRTSPERLRVMVVAGDSMSPTIDDGDIVLVDEGCQGGELNEGRVYVIRKGEEIFVKRYRKGVGCLLFMGDNRDRAYLDVEVTEADVDGFRVIGRVLWAGKEF